MFFFTPVHFFSIRKMLIVLTKKCVFGPDFSFGPWPLLAPVAYSSSIKGEQNNQWFQLHNLVIHADSWCFICQTDSRCAALMFKASHSVWLSLSLNSIRYSLSGGRDCDYILLRKDEWMNSAEWISRSAES